MTPTLIATAHDNGMVMKGNDGSNYEIKVNRHINIINNCGRNDKNNY